MSWAGAWPSPILKQSRDSLIDLYALVDAGSASGSDTVLAQLSRLLVIRATGHIEFTLEQSLVHFASAKSHPHVANYILSTVFHGRTVKPHIFLERIKDIDGSWAEELTSFLNEDDQLLYRELAFMVDRRNKLAHGQNQGIGVRKALDLANVALVIGDWLTETIDPR